MINAPIKYYSESEYSLRYGTEDSAGLDLPFYDSALEEVIIQPGETKLIKTGIHMEIPKGYAGFLDTRSSTGKAGLDLMARTIDADFRGNIRLMVINHSSKVVTIKRGTYVAQIIILKLYDNKKLDRVSNLNELTETERGNNGFGSTGGGI